MNSPESIVCLGAGRMGRGIAIVFAYAGHPVQVIDLKPRAEVGFCKVRDDADSEVRETLRMLAQLGMFEENAVDIIAGHITVVRGTQAAAVLSSAAIIFEAVPEVIDVKRRALACASQLARKNAIIASTTSTILVDDLSGAVDTPERFLNAHWLNPAYLVPLVELSPGKVTSPDITAKLKVLLEAVGKVPVVCAASPGYIVPRIQALAMNEAARMIEEGVATPEELDKAIKYGFGFRFAVLGLLEFIDWGGGDILYYASHYLSKSLNNERYAPPAIVERNMKEGRIGLRTGKGFLNYENVDLDAYRRARYKAFIAMLGQLDLIRPPVLPR